MVGLPAPVGLLIADRAAWAEADLEPEACHRNSIGKEP